MPIYLRGIERPPGRTVEVEYTPGGGGGGSSGIKTVKVPFQFDTPNIYAAGIPIYTPNIGEIITDSIDWWVTITEIWSHAYGIGDLKLSVFCEGEHFVDNTLCSLTVLKDYLNQDLGPSGQVKALSTAGPTFPVEFYDNAPILAKLYNSEDQVTPPVVTAGKAILGMVILN